MNIERGVQKQRVALLRLVAGWLAAVAFLSAAPISPVWTRWVCGFLASVLWRAEAAAQCLVIVQARLLDCSGEHRARVSPASFDPLSLSENNEPPLLVELRARLMALRSLLNNLPRHGLRLLRRIEKAGAACAAALTSSHGDLRHARRLAVSQCPPPLPWHPPELVSPESA